jgi:hypothetical protein
VGNLGGVEGVANLGNMLSPGEGSVLNIGGFARVKATAETLIIMAAEVAGKRPTLSIVYI